MHNKSWEIMKRYAKFRNSPTHLGVLAGEEEQAMHFLIYHPKKR
jgi:hypothetical protein